MLINGAFQLLIEISATLRIFSSVRTEREMAEIQEVGFQIDDDSESCMETNQEMAEVAIQTEEQSENTETSSETNQGSTKLAGEDVAVSGEDVAVSVEELQILMKKRLGELPGVPLEDRSVTIFRLPRWIRENNKELCEPKMLAIGPYHHGKESLQTTEEHKWYALRNFLARYENVDFEVYLQAMRSIEAEARNCYCAVDLSSAEFVMMLLLDGCFILEYFLDNNFYDVDAICGTGWANADLFFDIFLLENQLPFFVICKLFALANQQEGLVCHENCKSDQCLLHLLVTVFESFNPIVGPFKPPELSCGDIYHLLHLYSICMVPNSQYEIIESQRESVPRKSHHLCGFNNFSWSKLFSKKGVGVLNNEFIPLGLDQVNIQCVSELYDAGIKFKRKENPRSLLDISFKNGIIEMPYLQTDILMLGLLWNIAAFEQSQYSSAFPQTISSYLALMDSLINTEKDFAMLERFGIVNNFFRNSEEASTFFNKFVIFFVLDYSDHYFYDLFKDIKEYSESTWHRYRARLMQDYFSNPWTIISVVAAGILLILTVVQTYYSAAK